MCCSRKTDIQTYPDPFFGTFFCTLFAHHSTFDESMSQNMFLEFFAIW